MNYLLATYCLTGEKQMSPLGLLSFIFSISLFLFVSMCAHVHICVNACVHVCGDRSLLWVLPSITVHLIC